MSTQAIVVKPLGALAAALSQMRGGLYQSPPKTIAGIDDAIWYSPLQPVRPIAPEGTEPRGWQFYAGQNLIYTPRPDAEYSAADLKRFGMYDLVRVIIENTKDQLCRMPWRIQAKPKPGEPKAERLKREIKDENIAKLSRFFEYPNPEQNWSEWLRLVLEDMLVIDAASILIRRTLEGQLAELRPLRGESIVRYIDQNGFTPLPPSPGYAQDWWGIPLVNLTTDQLVYKPRNIVPRNTMASQLYGCSPAEQSATWIQVGMARLQWQLNFYTEGSIPDGLQVIPQGTPPDKIAESIAWMNSELAGNLAKRRQLRAIQGFTENGTDQILFPKDKALSDPFDDLVIRCLCFAFGTSPQRLMRMMNRASAMASQEASEEEGLLPWVDWVTGVINHIIQRIMGLYDYELSMNPYRETDTLKQAQADKLDAGIIRPVNEIRRDRGLDPRPEPEADQLGVFGPTGFIPLGVTAEPSPEGVPPGKKPNGKPDEKQVKGFLSQTQFLKLAAAQRKYLADALEDTVGKGAKLYTPKGDLVSGATALEAARRIRLDGRAPTGT